MLRRMGWNNMLERGIRKSLNRNEEREREGKVKKGKVMEAAKLGGRTSFAEEEIRFGFKDVCFVVLERHPDIRLEDYNEV